MTRDEMRKRSRWICILAPLATVLLCLVLAITMHKAALFFSVTVQIFYMGTMFGKHMTYLERLEEDAVALVAKAGEGE